MVLKSNPTSESVELIPTAPTIRKSEKPKVTESSVCYEVSSLPGKGQCLIAARNISAGETIASEKPLLHMPDKIFCLQDTRDIEAWIDKQINRLSCDNRSTFFDLSDCQTPPEEGSFAPQKTSFGIFFTNAMNYRGDAALFPLISRANHSCAPNADFLTREPAGAQEIVAAVDISRGQEITLCYLPAAEQASDVREVRRAYTREFYGFHCNCRACTLEDDALAANDVIRTRIRSVQKALKDDSTDPVPLSDLSGLIDDLRSIHCKPTYVVDVAEIVLDAAIALGDRRVAAKAAVAGYIAHDILHGETSGQKNAFEFALRSRLIENFDDGLPLFRGDRSR